MPLPPALAARLAKRGIIGEEYGREKRSRPEAEEEVIAENYDRDIKGREDEMSSAQAERQFKGHPGCPNKWNVYHECNTACVNLWGRRFLSPDPSYLRKQISLLTKYPLPPGWKQVYDPGTGRHYYWEVTSDLVSWLPPGHPRSIISESAATLREERHLAATDRDSDQDTDSDDSEETAPARGPEHRPPPGERNRRDTKPKGKANDLDPMDPASYSDIPRGKWSDGLERFNEAKTGADVTAAGPLFQMRPYPSPGAVLRANASAVDKPPP